ncbi:uncharacterized protein LOC107368757 isoform X1 [Tetranychus urticae]|uniref:uncharacterized protein LOC107368757 isoform X1 n=1 Tax=Tetranychus urticae TaxID=32264 RepID=UPI00077BD2FC|nr:uncharacterized protein LOC107368757 isoform X1 [Tetranychus urticae]
MDPALKDKLDKFKTVIKSIIIPYKHGISLDQIQKDFKELEGTFLPCTIFGYKNPRDFLDSMSDVLIKQPNLYGEPVYRARFDDDTVHIQEMVMQQKATTKRKKKKPFGGYGGHGGYNNYYSGHRYNIRPSTNYWNPPVTRRPPINRPSSQSVNSRPVLPAGLEQNDLDEWGSRPSVQRPSVQRPRPTRHVQVSKQPLKASQVNNTQGLSSNRPPPGPPNNVRATAPFLSAQDVANIKELLKDHGKEGINLNFLKTLYEKKYQQTLDPHARGFSDLQHALSTISHICKVELHPSRKFYIVKLVDNPIKKPETPKPSKNPPKNDAKGPDDVASAPPRKVVSLSDNPSDIRVEVQNGIDSEALENFPSTAISYFKKILEKYPHGITAENFLSEYENISGAPLEPTNWGYFSLIDIFYGLPSLFFVDPADARSGQENDCDAIIYNSNQVPPEVRQRVDAYHAKTNQGPLSEKQQRWSFKLKIMALLMKATEGISISNFSTDFYLNFKESLDPCVYDYKDYSDMFEHLSKELPIKLEGSYSGDDITVSLQDDWQTQWVDICVNNNQYDALKQMIVPDNVVLPGDIISEVDVDQATVDEDVWHQIILTSVVNPNCIFVNLVGKYHSDALDTLMHKLKFYADLSPSCRDYDVPIFYLRENFFCTAAFDVDNCWHRVKIVKVEPDKKKVKVAFIDFGGEQYIESCKLRLMKKEFSYLPSQAIRLSLRGIRPKTDKWPSNAKDEVLDFMNRALNQKENILCRLHKRRSSQAKESVRFEAEVCAKTSLGYVFLHKQLIESGLAIIDEEATHPSKNDVMIPSNDVHRPLRKPTRVNPRKMISTLRRLQIKNKSGSEEPSSSVDGQNVQ